jgi:hypothetical protein
MMVVVPCIHDSYFEVQVIVIQRILRIAEKRIIANGDKDKNRNIKKGNNIVF